MMRRGPLRIPASRYRTTDFLTPTFASLSSPLRRQAVPRRGVRPPHGPLRRQRDALHAVRPAAAGGGRLRGLRHVHVALLLQHLPPVRRRAGQAHLPLPLLQRVQVRALCQGHHPEKSSHSVIARNTSLTMCAPTNVNLTVHVLSYTVTDPAPAVHLPYIGAAAAWAWTSSTA